MTHKKTLSGWEEKAIERYYYEDNETDDFDEWEDEDYDNEPNNNPSDNN